jgi:UDP-N-acetylmuramoyl-L-alanyl-D-glutamate--2,6-diaminopimelate ligase
MKSLQDLTAGIKTLQTKGNLDVSVSSISLNSKIIEPQSLFVALNGNMTDGHIFIDQAIENGAKVIVHEHDLSSYIDRVAYIKVEDSHEAVGIIASNFYDNPSKKLKLIGITGTNGKTTTATLLHQLFRNLGCKAGMIGTVVNKVNDDSYEAERTTPDPIDLNKLLYSMVDRGCQYCFMEVSSHSVSEKRIAGLTFVGGVFTNLTHDHLDYHKTIESYRDAKKMFFDGLSENAFSLSNKDDANGEYMLKDTKAKKYFYSLKTEADFTDRLETKLIGEFNAYNALAVYATAVLLGQDKKNVKELIKGLRPVEGRFNYIKSKDGITGIVDYAHTPDALENVLKAIIDMRGDTIPVVKNRKIISVFGCGGDRDRAKRPIMAKIGYDMSDIIILTSDNPRTENPEHILEEMKNGLPDQSKVHIISDRNEAIKKACSIAKRGDFILLAGKGHEKYQEVDGVKNHFDDMEELKKCFNV